MICNVIHLFLTFVITSWNP